MKNIDVTIKNFGKIKQAQFQVKPFTVIAGKNACGKSFITRALYSIFNSLNKDHLSIEFDEVIFNITVYISVMLTSVDKPSQRVEDSLMKIDLLIDDLTKSVDLVFNQNTLNSQLAQKDKLIVDIQQLQQTGEALDSDIGTTKKYLDLSTYLDLMLQEIKKLIVLVKNPHKALNAALQQQLEQSLIDNFQVSALDKLKNKETTGDVNFDFGKTIGHLSLPANQLQIELNPQGIDAFQQIDNVVYLESPMYWKIKEVLKGWINMRNDPALRRQKKHQQKELKKIPQYILDTFELLDSDVVQSDSHDELTQLKQTINQCIGGHIQISDSGDLQFYNQNEHGKPYAVDLNQAATGATALGIIALLLEKNVIVPNSVLIFDEPEVNLHPAWQQVMIQVLYQLSLAGVNIVMATHSFDMIESIEKLMDSHEQNNLEVDEHFSIVQLDDGVSINHDKPIFKKLDAVKADLGMPLFDLFTKSQEV